MTKEDELRQLILARRARFIAAALCTSGVVMAGCTEAEPSVCLSPPYYPGWSSDAGSHPTTDTEPSVCLSPTYVEVTTTETGTLVDPTGTEPSVCLSPTYVEALSSTPPSISSVATAAEFDAGSDAAVDGALDAALDAAVDAAVDGAATEPVPAADGGSDASVTPVD